MAALCVAAASSGAVTIPKTIIDHGRGLAVDKIDNFTFAAACAGIADLGNFVTVIIYDE